MVFALLLLSLAMIVGGLFAVVLGWDIVLLERGWAMVIAGSVAAGSGAVLLGLTAAVGRLGAVRSEMASLREEINRLAAPVPPEPVVDPLSAASGGVVAGGPPEAEPVAAGEREREGAPGLPDFLRPQGADGARPNETEPRARRSYDPDGLLADEDERPQVRDEERPVEPPEDRSAGADLPREGALPPFEPEDQADRVRTPPAEAAAPGAGPLPGPEPAEEPKPKTDAEPKTESEPEASPTVVGTYNSGDNRYVMFSDGSIQAETPDGVFRFNSLDELKEFIASGGESASGSP